jgi:uncharacterized protein YqcC (DUF446 family)
MRDSFGLIADQLLLIEQALRAQGWWDAQAPSAEALASEQPFCVDTLDFSQWLQWVFLPRMEDLIANGRALPMVSAIRPLAEQLYGAENPQTAALFGALGEVDRLISKG